MTIVPGNDGEAEIRTAEEAVSAVVRAWPVIVEECREVLGSELHYQAMIYHCLRVSGGIPLRQLGMNVKQWVQNPTTPLFRQEARENHPDYQTGYETIPDVAVFASQIEGDWRRRNRLPTLRHLLLGIEVKVSERQANRLRPGEVRSDIEKLAAHRDEVGHLGGRMHPMMIVLDTAPNVNERMTNAAREQTMKLAETAGVSYFYLSPHDAIDAVAI